MAFRTSLRLCHLGWESVNVVVVEPWSIEYLVAAGEDSELVAVHAEVAPTFTVGMADGKLVVRVNERGSSFEFWRAGRLYEEMSVHAPPGGSSQHAPGVPSVRITPMVPLANYSISAPVHLTEESPGHMVLRSRPSTVRNWRIVSLLLVILLFVSLAAISLLTLIQIQQGNALGALLVAVISASSLGAAAVVLFSSMRKVRGWARGSVVHFDRNGNVLNFVCPLAETETRALSAIVALQLLPTTARAVRSQLETSSGGWTDRLLNWFLTRFKQYQLNLVFADGSRLNLTFLEKRQPIEEMALQLADFLSVPLIRPTGA